MELGTTQSFASPAEALAHISEVAWSNWTKADYTLEQWHAACLLHTHDGAPTSKSECKLPVKTPDGILSRNGVHAAAAALAGARGGLKGVSAEQKTKAANALKRYYSQLDEDPPESLSQADAFVDNFLAHHGVKGMRWGVRNERETGSSPKKSSVVGVDPVTAAIGAIYVGTILATLYVTARDIRRASKDDSGTDVQKKTADVPWKPKPELAKKMSVDDIHDKIVKQVNPGYGRGGTKMNCRRCTFSYEMRRRGYDVKATRSHYATGQDLEGVRQATMQSVNKQRFESSWGQKRIASADVFQNSTGTQKSEHIFRALAKEPDGARGELGVGWKMGGGHSMAWEIVGGKPIIFDTQSSKTYRDSEDFKRFAKITTEAAYTRTDNIKLDEHFLRKWVTNVE